jgi:hypothetical protein
VRAEEVAVVAEHIRVDVERTGGFGGLTTRRSADTESLPAEEAQRLTELVSALDRAALDHATEPARPVPDGFEYAVSISRAGRNVRLHVRDPDVPPQLRTLIRFVVQGK